MIENQIAPNPAEANETSSPAEANGNGSDGSPPGRGWFHRGSRPPRPPQHRRSRTRAVTETLIGLVVALLLALGVRAWAFQVYFVPSTSMVPTLKVGDRIVVDKFLFDYHTLHPGQIIVFRTPSRAKSMCATSDGDLVKRVVAVAGQTIWSIGNRVYVNGKLQNESYLPKGTQLGTAINRQTIPRDDVFVLGDNRSISCDSRVWGPVPGKNIVGTVVAIVWQGWHPDVHFF